MPGPAASIIRPMMDSPDTCVSPRRTSISASKVATSFTNFAAARACRPRWLLIVTVWQISGFLSGFCPSIPGAPCAGAFSSGELIGSPVRQQRGSDVDVLLTGLARGGHGVGQRFLAAHAGQLDQHRQVHTGDHLDLRLVHDGDGEVGRGSAEHVGQHDDAGPVVHVGHGVQNVLAALLHVVVWADAHGPHLLLLTHHMLQRGDELFREAPVGYQNHTDHGTSFNSGASPEATFLLRHL
ncbi:protein of unknown function (plasmid) [Azospirillum baldaniorum]|uniref:Uncharacterized protein n=1 Tax=Azospirillum baldaniorum TaxID=1064539 RepID=A0A9P1K0D8_9PROT|nr:protein of unknown function [Azospirillum baldaniorum]